MPPLDVLIASFRAELMAREAARVRDLVRAYHGVWIAIQPRLNRLTAAIDAARGRGDNVMVALFERERLAVLGDQIIAEMQRVTGLTYTQILAEQRHAASLGSESAQAFLRQIIEFDGGFLRTPDIRLPARAVESIVGALQEGTPLRALLMSEAPATWQAIEAQLVEAVALGRHPSVIAPAIRDALGSSMHRALTISRTEVLRAYRTSQLETYRQTNVIKGWVWSADMSGRTCAACMFMHGSWHPLDEEMESHPNCRCAESPCLTGPDEDGYVHGEPYGDPGPERFGALSDDMQRSILGPGKFAAYQDGDIELGDLVSVRESAQWGRTRSVGSLSDARARASGRAA